MVMPQFALCAGVGLSRRGTAGLPAPAHGAGGGGCWTDGGGDRWLSARWMAAERLSGRCHPPGSVPQLLGKGEGSGSLCEHQRSDAAPMLFRVRAKPVPDGPGDGVIVLLA
ncbi:unnamed protein product [Boreogadus saida]